MASYFQGSRIFANFYSKRVRQWFEQVWDTLPREDRRQLERALVNITDYMWLSGKGVALYDPTYRTIQVRGSELEKLDENLVKHMIAWTFAHALWTQPGIYELDKETDGEAAAQAESWGFPRPTALVDEARKN
ncbi:MAG: hypothetical protein GX495_06945 [Chloroflexi bacterium]|jgi:hypothetical protein|nr:hypothetical protein [Chloroflexota bacterium]